MLLFSAIDSTTLELLKRIMYHPFFGNLYLCGGTSLALQIGHRKSIDIDLFGKVDVDEITISKILNEFGVTQIIKHTPNILVYTVNDVKVDIVNYPYPWIQEPLISSEIRLAQKKDIAAMKLAAITGRGSKKDFIDLYFLLNDFSLKEMLEFYTQKYADGSPFMVLKSLTYFDDADLEPNPFMLVTMEWEKVKATLTKNVENFVNSLGS